MENTFDWNQKRVKEIVSHYTHNFFYQKKVLDLGCGYGDIGGVLYRLGAEVTAVDARQDHLKIVSKKFAGIKVIRADLDRDWPFYGQVFDLVLDMGILCHLSNFENHLRAICSSARHLVLETAVCDSEDPNKSISTPENKGVYDLSINGMGCRPSAAAIERVLRECGMTFKRMDSSKFNSGTIIYDWQSRNDGTANIDKRRIWFCSKGEQVKPDSVSINSSGNKTAFLQNSYLKAGSPAPAFKKTSSPRPPSLPPIHPTHPHVYSNANPTTQVIMNPSYVGGFSSNVDEVRESNKRFALINPEQTPLQFGKSGEFLPITTNPQLKVLYLPLGEQPGMYDAFRNIGVNLQVFNFWDQWLATKNKAQIQRDFLQKVQEFQPNLIHMQLQFTGLMDGPTLREARKSCPGVVITNWSGDIRKNAIFDFVTLTHTVDYLLISSTGQLDLYRRAGCNNVRYWQIGYDPKFNFPMHNKNFDYDASFLGNVYPAQSQFTDSDLRSNTVTSLKRTFGNKFGLFGSGYPQCSPVDPKQANGIYNKSICPISISNFNNVSHYFSDRLMACIASGRPTIAWYFPGIESYFVEGNEILIARSLKDVVDHINYCKNNVEAANQIGINGHRRALKEYTFTSRVLELLTMTNLIQVA